MVTTEKECYLVLPVLLKTCDLPPSTQGLEPTFIGMHLILIEKLISEIKQPVFHDRLSDFTHKIGQKIQIMIGRQTDAERLVRFNQMTDISARVVAACITVTLRIQWSKVAYVSGIPHNKPSLARHRCPISGDAGRKYTVKHINTADGAFDQCVR